MNAGFSPVLGTCTDSREWVRAPTVSRFSMWHGGVYYLPRGLHAWIFGSAQEGERDITQNEG